MLNNSNYTSYQLSLPLPVSEIIDISDPVYTFCEVINHLDIHKYFSTNTHDTGRPEYDKVKLFKIVMFAFMDNGYVSLRNIEKLCKTDIRFMWLLAGSHAPCYSTIRNFISNCLSGSIDTIFADINNYIFNRQNVDMDHIYIDGSKMRANAGKYTWVWAKTCKKRREQIFRKLSDLIKEINEQVLSHYRCSFEIRKEYAVEYVDELCSYFLQINNLDRSAFVHGKGRKKSPLQKYYECLQQYCEQLKKCCNKIKICGNKRNSYSKTDHDATFLRMGMDRMGNDRLLPAYNVNVGVCDEYIAAFDVFQYAADFDCFQPLVDKFYRTYGFYPKYPIADAGYGNFNNYLYCEEHGMEKFMKFTMFDKETKDKRYRLNPFRARNFRIDSDGYLVCPGNKRFYYVKDNPVKGNKYNRTEEIYQCENCDGCPNRNVCTKGQGNRTIVLNKELTSIHEEVLGNLNSVHGMLLRVNRCIQAEGTFGSIKWNRAYNRIRRRGKEAVKLEIGLIFCGFNLHKYHLKTRATAEAA